MGKSKFGPRVDAFGSWQTDRQSFAGSGGSNWMAGAELRIDLLPLKSNPASSKRKPRCCAHRQAKKRRGA